MSQPLPIACTLTEPEQRTRRSALMRDLSAVVAETRELADGFALRFPGSSESLSCLFGFLLLERSCCRFLHFRLELAPGLGDVWLSVDGPAGTKEFLRDWLQ